MRDGAMGGPNIDGDRRIGRAVNIPVNALRRRKLSADPSSAEKNRRDFRCHFGRGAL